MKQQRKWKNNSTHLRISSRSASSFMALGAIGRFIVRGFNATPEHRELSANARLQRLSMLGFVIAIFVGVIALRLCELQTTEHQRWLNLASRQQQSTVEVRHARATVVDALGKPLAVSVPSVSVAVHPQKVKNCDDFVRRLTSVVDVDVKDVREKLKTEKPFVWIKRDLPRSVARQISDLNLEGICVVDEFQRSYPQGFLAGPIIGRTGRDGYGLGGVEYAFDGMLSADGGMELPVGRDARGRLVAVSEYGFNKPSRDVEPQLRLSIDAVVQGILEEEFNRALETMQAKQVFGLVMDADTGEILASAQSSRAMASHIQDLSADELKNVVIQDAFEPGSTLKPFIAAKAIDESVHSPNDMMDCENGTYAVGRHIIRDVHPIGMASLREAIVRSSNICMAKVGQRLGRNRVYEALSDFGFGQKSGIELPGEAAGILRDGKRWANIDVATHSFGHGISVTSLQLVRAYSALLNGGLLVTPTVINGGTRKKGSVIRVLGDATSSAMRDILYDVIADEHGTGRKAQVVGVRVAGKTGTAHKVLSSGRGYDSERVMASFVGFVDGSDIGLQRRFTALVVVDEPGVTPRWGGAVAAPVFSSAMERILSYVMTKETSKMQMAKARSSEFDA